MPSEDPAVRVSQEIFCTTSGGGCGGFIRVRLNAAINHKVQITCPKCGHVHYRSIIKGVIHEKGRFDGNTDKYEELFPTMGAWSEKPLTKVMNRVQDGASISKERDGAVIKKPGHLVVADQAHMFIRESWEEKHTPD